MKSCPTCNRTYPDDTLAFCLIDGSVLSAPYDPQETRRSAGWSGGNSTQTQVLHPTVPSEPAPGIQSTIRAPAPQVPPMFAEVRPVLESEEKKSKAPWVIAGIAVLLAVVLGVVLLVSLWPNKSETTNKQSNSRDASITGNRSNLACTFPLSAPIYDKWIQMEGENGRLKCPVESESEAPNSPQGTTGRWVRFSAGDGGYLVWHRTGPKAGQVFEVSGCMYKLYSSLGGTKSWLGFPTVDGHEKSTGARQDFEAGYIVWDSKTYVCNAHKN
jgi:hypothetical protein